MGFWAAIGSVFSRYATFRGRARRAEFWKFSLFCLIVSMLAGGGVGMWGGMSEESAGLIALVFLLPSLAVTWRRLHDTDRSGGWFFVQLIPLVGLIILIVMLCQDGTDGPNRFGPDPKPRLHW